MPFANVFDAGWRCGGGAIDEEALIEGLKLYLGFLPGLGIDQGGPATWSRDRLEVKIVTLLAVLLVLQMDFNRVAHHDADHGPWHGSIKTPELIIVIVANRTNPLGRFQGYHDGGGLGSCDGRGTLGAFASWALMVSADTTPALMARHGAMTNALIKPA
jgi:hypothetical protein